MPSRGTPNAQSAGSVTRRPRSNDDPGAPPASTSMEGPRRRHQQASRRPGRHRGTPSRVQPAAGPRVHRRATEAARPTISVPAAAIAASATTSDPAASSTTPRAHLPRVPHADRPTSRGGGHVDHQPWRRCRRAWPTRAARSSPRARSSRNLPTRGRDTDAPRPPRDPQPG